MIDFARDRGIRVVLEFDTPGHTLVIGKSFPRNISQRYTSNVSFGYGVNNFHGILELLTPCYGDGINPGTPNYPCHAPYEILDPTKEFTYEFMQRLFSEIRNVTKDEYIHLGMDEVNEIWFQNYISFNYTCYENLIFTRFTKNKYNIRVCYKILLGILQLLAIFT